MLNLKKSVLAVVALLASTSAFAANVQIQLDGRAMYLPECGGTIEANKSSASAGGDQMNLVLRNVKNCSNFILHETGREYKIPGPDGDRTGSYTITASRLDMGLNYVRMTVRSNSGATRDDVSIVVRVVPAQPNYASCYGEAKSAALRADRGNGGYEAWATFDRVSNSGNLVYDVRVTGRGVRHYEVVLGTNCAEKNTSRK